MSTLYQTSIPLDAIDEEELRDLVQKLARVSGKQIEIQHQLIISTDDQNLTVMLDSLAETIRDGGPVKTTQKKLGGGERQTRKAKGKKAQREPGVRSWEITSGQDAGEKISRRELNKKLSAHEILPGTTLHSPKYGDVTVRNGGPEGTPYTLADESGVSI